MNLKDLRPAKEFAKRFGVKSIVYGPPGSGKTPLFNTAPKPLLLAIEPGLVSMRNSEVPTWFAETPDQIDEFFRWLFESSERKNFETIGVDSASYMAQRYLDVELNGKSNAGNKKHGEAAYGEMLRHVMKHLTPLYYLQQMHAYIICHEGTRADGKLIPGFPGRALEKEVPHLYDLIMHVGIHNIPGYGQHKSFQTEATLDILARDRSGMLNQFEECNLAAVFNKASS